MKFWEITFSLTLALTCLAPVSRAASGLDGEKAEGLEHLTAGRYQHAETCLRQVAEVQPGDPAVHYYLANALVHLGKHKEAIREYQTSYKLDPYGTVSGYCRKALEAYRADIPAATVASGAGKSAVGSTFAAVIHEYGTTPGPMNDAIGKIRQEAESEKGRHKQFADSLSAAAMKTGELQAGQIQEAAKDEIDRIYNPAPVMIGRAAYNPLMFTPEMQKAKADEVRKNADEASRLARMRAEERADIYKRWTQDRAYVLDETAANLENQLHARNLPGTPRLAATGTGLYVRNYAPPEHPYPYPEPHAGIVRIHRVLVGPQVGYSANQAEGDDGASADRPGGIVRGTIIRPDFAADDRRSH